MFSASKSGQYPGYLISRSVRLRNSASAYFNRTPASTTNRRTMTFSFWMKRGLLTYSANYLDLFTAYPGTSAIDRITFSPSSDSLRVWFNGSSSADLITTQVFRDPSAWYHIVVAIDTTQATASNRIKVYVNGSQVTSFSTSTYPSQNYDTYWNSSSYASAIGANLNGPQSYFDGYLTEINFIDGQALTPSSFGVTNAYGVWSPIKYNGTYGTNGYYLNFSDNSGATATTIGKDSSGNGNNWTPNNISVTAGTTYDSMLDVPTLNSPNAANYAVLNPLDQTNQTVSGANLNTVSTGTAGRIRGTIGAASGKWYFEHTLTAYSAGGAIGVMNINKALGSGDIGANADEWGFLTNSGSKINSGSTTGYGSAITTNDILMCALDLDNSKIWWGNNGTWFASGDPAAGTNAAFTNVTGYTVTPAVGLGNGSSQSWAHNFGQRPFAYTPPSGFKALNTFNLPESTIQKGNQYFDVSLYTGTGASNNTVTNSGMQPDMLWIKSRSLGAGGNHMLVDSVRGVGTGTSTAELYPNLTNAESPSNAVTSLNSNGFTLTGGTGVERYNASSNTYVGWQWKAGGTPAVTNTNGSITSTVSANTTAGFSVVTYTGTGANATVGHGLGVKPAMAIVKNRSSAFSWGVWHKSLAAETYYLVLNSTAAAAGPDDVFTAFSSTTFSLSVDNWSNANGSNYVCYLFAEVAGFSAFGSYTGNGSTDGPFVFTGFRPRWVMIKRTDAADSWVIEDSSRDPYNVDNKYLLADSSGAEGTATPPELSDLLSNGFKKRSSNQNASGGTYVYAAFAENPFKNALAR